MSNQPATIIQLIQSYRFDLSNEKRVQTEIAEAFTANGVEFEREKRLSERDIPDFFLPGGIAVECKMRGARKMDIYKQLCRYAEHNEVTALILVSNLAMGLPPEIGGKPAYFASLGRGWM